MGLGDERFARPAWDSKRSELIKRLRRSLKIATPDEKVVPAVRRAYPNLGSATRAWPFAEHHRAIGARRDVPRGLGLTPASQ